MLSVSPRDHLTSSFSASDRYEFVVFRLSTAFEKTFEKLEKDSEVRWYRDEYKEILKKYDTVQTELEKEIEKREKELAVINSGLNLMTE